MFDNRATNRTSSNCTFREFIMKYTITYKFSDYDAEIKKWNCENWNVACKAMRGLLVDGYEVLGLEMCR